MTYIAASEKVLFRSDETKGIFVFNYLVRIAEIIVEKDKIDK